MSQKIKRENAFGAVQGINMNSMFLIIGSVFASLIFISGAVEYSNRWTVQINGDVGEAERLAVKHGFVNQGKVRLNCEVLILTGLTAGKLKEN